MNERVREKLERLPRAPGVYVMRAAGGAALYVGKATDLRSRVRSYFTPGTTDARFFVSLLDALLDDLETIVTADAREALLLENSLIKELRPRYNIRLRDDKDYLSIRLDARVPWPRLELVRRPQPDGARYFGPFANAHAAREAVRVVQRLFRLRPCRDSVFRGRARPCLLYQIGRCDGPCVLPVDPAAYATAVRRTAALLEGRRDAVLGELRDEMRAAAGTLDFERAARLRDQLAAVEHAAWGEPQRVVEVSDVDRDVVGLHRDGPVAVAVVLEVRAGRLVAVRGYPFADLEVPDPELLAGFLGQRYAGAAAAPHEILLPFPAPESDVLESYLSAHTGRRTRILVPRRGRGRRLLELARQNAEQRFLLESRDRESATAQAEALARALRLRRPPRTIECVDISHWGGEAGTTVAAVAALRDGEPDRARYRRFRLRGDHRGDDYAALREVLLRRFERARSGDPKWAAPDLLVVDGGRGQLAVARAVFNDLGVAGTALAAIAKPHDAPLPSLTPAVPAAPTAGPEHLADNPDAAEAETAAPEPSAPGPAPTLTPPDAPAAPDATSATPAAAPADPRVPVDTIYVAGRKNPLRLRPGSPALHLLARLRDETHRCAVTFQAAAGGRRRLTDRLAEVPGVGPVTRRRLLRAFGSVARVAQATAEQLAAVPGVTTAQAHAVARHLAAAEPGTGAPTQ
jgi:excinuclease ABC subunit C